MLKRLIPDLVKSKLNNRPNLQKILKNMGWLSFDKLFQLIIAFTIGVWLTRYLGPSDYGVMNFAFALGGLFSPLIGLGIGSLIVKELVSKDNDKNVVLGSCLFINLVTSSAVFILLNVVSIFLNPNNPFIILIVFIYSLNFIIGSFYGVIVGWFNSKIEAKANVISYNVAIVFSSVLKIILILGGFSLVYFMIVGLLETILISFLLVYFYKKSGENIYEWKLNFSYVKKILSFSWPLVLSGTMVIIYMKIDQIMIAILLDTTQLGLYSISVRLSEIFYFLPGIIVSSLFPTMIKLKETNLNNYFLKLKRLFYFVTWIPFLIIIPFSLFSKEIVYFLYGVEFLGAAAVVSISIWALLAVFVKTAVEAHLLNENLTGVIFVNSFMGAALNIILNYFLIPVYGIMGAAISTVISYFVVAYLGLLFFKKTKKLFFMLIASFNILNGLNYLRKKIN